MPGEGFPAQLRLRQRREFLAVQRLGRKHHTRHFLVFVSRDADPARAPRIGITVTKKIGNAVQRNWIKRRVREVFRRKHHEFNGGLQMVWIAKRQALGLSFGEVEKDFAELMLRRGICDESSSRHSSAEGGPLGPAVTKGAHK
jgi:ribonuclease P protein component